MLIYVDLVTERLQYTLEYIFTLHGLQYRCTNDQREFLDFSGAKLNYSEWDCGTGECFVPSALLFEEKLDPGLRVEKSEWEGVPMLLLNGVADPFAAIFYVLSRYEEYVDQKEDAHGRFEATSSVLYKFGWLQQQVVELWVEAIIGRFVPEQLGLLKESRSVTLIPSFDIDNTFAYKWKKGWRKFLAFARDVLRKDEQRLAERRSVNAGHSQDPYDSFEAIRSVAARFPETRIFWLLADYSTFDRNLPWHDPRHQRLIRSLDREAKVGLHPGYVSNSSDKVLTEEKERLAKILGRPVKESRQHFLKLRLPVTYNRLMDQGFERDFTMGHADQPGFRAGTAHTFFFFDLRKNVQTNYQIVPFVYMDGTFRDYLKLQPEACWPQIENLGEQVKRFGGNFCFIWHNESIGTSEKWKGWPEIMERTLRYFS